MHKTIVYFICLLRLRRSSRKKSRTTRLKITDYNKLILSKRNDVIILTVYNYNAFISLYGRC